VTIIYVTEFNPETKQCSSPSKATDVTSLDQIVEQHGEPLSRTTGWVLYDGVIYSKLKWCYGAEVSFL
jgi:hypothetical protein